MSEITETIETCFQEFLDDENKLKEFISGLSDLEYVAAWSRMTALAGSREDASERRCQLHKLMGAKILKIFGIEKDSARPKQKDTTFDEVKNYIDGMDNDELKQFLNEMIISGGKASSQQDYRADTQDNATLRRRVLDYMYNLPTGKFQEFLGHKICLSVVSDTIRRVTLQQFKTYCDTWGLTYVVAPNSPLDDQEEWPDTAAAGFYGHPALCAVACWLKTDGTFNAIIQEADGTLYMEPLSASFSAKCVTSGKKLHSE